MKAVILSAGLGTRLKPITDKIPKPMVKVAGKPVLEHLVHHLYQYGISQIIVNLHYKPGAIMSYFGSTILYSYEKDLLGEEGTLESLKHWLINDYTVVMNGDTLTDIDIMQMFRWSKGRNIKSMENEIYTGTMIIGPQYFMGNKKFVNYYDPGMYWQDMGTPEGLKAARKRYEELGGLRTV